MPFSERLRPLKCIPVDIKVAYVSIAFLYFQYYERANTMALRSEAY